MADFSYSLTDLEVKLLEFTEKTDRIGGFVAALSSEIKKETLLVTLIVESIINVQIEGEFLSRCDVASSIRNNLGFTGAKKIRDLKSAGMASLTAYVHQYFYEKLTEEMLFKWHQMIFPVPARINVGQWRFHDEPMQIVSGTIGREEIHFEAPPSAKVPAEMQRFITWFNQTAPNREKTISQAPIRSAIAHLYFETIHPFEDGNGRIGRAIAEKALFQTLGYPLLISMSAAIEEKRQDYYQALKEAQRSNEITPWLAYFLNMLIEAQEKSEQLITFTLKKAQLFDQYSDQLNTRQLKVIRRMLREGPGGFKGGMTAKKYMKIADTSKATATRDLQRLSELGILKVSGGGRTTSYQIDILDS